MLRVRFVLCLFTFVLAARAIHAQDTTSATTAGTTAPPLIPQSPPQGKPWSEPPIIEDGGLSIEPIYWFNRSQPSLRGGVAATEYGSLGYPGDANSSVGGEIGVPAGRSNTLRISYFRVQGNGNTTLGQDASLFGESYTAGDFLNASYTLQAAKISWDYLSYSWDKAPGKLRLKTLWEVQYVNVGTNVEAPFKPVTTDSSGNTDNNFAHGTSNLIYPTFGLELEQMLGKRFRWEAKASGFGIPHHGYIWDGDASLAFRVRDFEVMAGEKSFGFRTSPQSAEYFGATFNGPYVGLRYYWGARE